jgi:hypothetical protein
MEDGGRRALAGRDYQHRDHSDRWRQGGDHQARYCSKVDAYRINSCAKTILPATPVGRQLGWVLAPLDGQAPTLTRAEVRAHVSAEFLTVVMPPQAMPCPVASSNWERAPGCRLGGVLNVEEIDGMAARWQRLADHALLDAASRPFGQPNPPGLLLPRGHYWWGRR